MGHAITNLVDGFEVDRFVAELFAEPADMRVQCSRSCLAVISPDSVHQHLAREHVSTRAHEFLEKLEFFRRQRDRSITGKYMAALRKELDLADAEHVCPILVGKIQLFPQRRQVLSGNRTVTLTAKEFELLQELMR